MQLSAILLTIATAVMAAPSAEPAAAEPGAIEARAQHLATWWEHAGFSGSSFNSFGDPGVCTNFPAVWNDRFSSARAVAGWKCRVWDNAGCGGNSFGDFTNAGSNFPSLLNDRGSSWRCVRV
ncbi:hypothetical protein QBC35DRAFT_390125 [Podospora australis]|uniref:Uncharacterized protein n=1 Tax=Podospora australis TaxID=1536484 RepID=A0AAN6WP08_9PEZI|nr:hypothetical protein QBC35DRAFT_390125 [Podospora australis]